MSKLSLGVQKMASSSAITGPADIRDQRWLDERVSDLGAGIDAAREIWSNWYDGRRVGRLHPDVSPGEYIASLGYRLTLAEAMAALPEVSNVQIAAVAGVSDMTVGRAKRASTNVDPDATVLGADGKHYPAHVLRVVEVIEPEEPESFEWPGFRDAIAAMEGLIGNDPETVAVPKSRIPTTRASLKRVHSWLGAVIAELDKR